MAVSPSVNVLWQSVRLSMCYASLQDFWSVSNEAVSSRVSGLPIGKAGNGAKARTTEPGNDGNTMQRQERPNLLTKT